jgi:beta-lactamase superfamily II metal-dependent hydrolase
VIDVCKARSPSLNALLADALRSKQASPYPFADLDGEGNSLHSALASALRSATLRSTPAPPNPFAGLAGDGSSSHSALASALRTDPPNRLQPSTGPLQTENPIDYIKERGLTNVFRFILTHPEMDHMDGIKDLFDEFRPTNFWDTDNSCTKSFSTGSRFREEDWTFYRGLRDGCAQGGATRLSLYSGSCGPFYNRNGSASEAHDGLHVLAPTPSLIAEANRTGDFNDACYVILYQSSAGRILFCGDTHDKTWAHLLENHLEEIQDVELMIAPHHGRDSGRDRAFLSAVRPKFTLFGIAPSEHLAYDAWRNRDLCYITNHQAGTVIVDTNGDRMQVYVARKSFARAQNPFTTYSPEFKAWYLTSIS